MKNMVRILWAWIAVCWAAAAPVSAQYPGATLNVPATLEAESTIPKAGDTVTLALVMRPAPTWHGYWKNGGDAGVGMQLQWSLPRGVSAGELRYPVPQRLMIAGLMNYVYERPYTLLVDLKIAADIAPGTALPIKLRGDWLACTDKICVPEGDDLAINLTTGSGLIDAGTRTKFDAYRAALPVPINQTARYRIDGQHIALAVPYPATAALEAPYFFPLTEKIISYSAPQSAERRGDVVVVKTKIDAFSGDDFDGGPIEGVFQFGPRRGIIVKAVPGDSPAFASSAANSVSNDTSFAVILFFAVLGGLLLNLMPCVFPILGLKALSLAKMGGDGRAAKRDAAAYTLGAIVTCTALGGALLLLRAGGEQVGWAFQLQEPRLVLLLWLLMVAVTINLLGGFAMASVNAAGGLANKGGAAGAFWTGALAAVIATPCTGPFMAAALGAALLLPAAQALLLFAGLGLGLALPYLAIAYVPAARRFLPKPGAWLETFRRWMAAPMAITAAALLWLLWRLAGPGGLITGLIAALLLAVLLLWLGRTQQKGGLRFSVFAVMIAAISAAAVIALPKEAIVATKAQSSLLNSEPYSEAAMARYRAAGKPVFAYFTADWCVTCKVNEAAAIERSETAAAFEKAGIKVLVGDFTRADPGIARALAQYGRSGVPLYLYAPTGGDVQILPQILTAQMLIRLTQKDGG